MFIPRNRDLLFLGAFLGLCYFSCPLMADEEKLEGGQDSATEVSKESAIDLVERLRQLNRQTPEGDTREEMFKNYRNTQQCAFKNNSLYTSVCP